MLQLVVKITGETYDEDNQIFVDGDVYILELEHSLLSLAKWESKYKKAFLGPIEKTQEETMGYVEAMCVNPFTPSEVFSKLNKMHFDQINDYIGDTMTATIINEPKTHGRPKEIITNELIYYWIVSYQIPWEVETWHLNRLFTLIKVFNVKNAKPKKMGRNELAQQRRMLNEQRRQQHGTSG